MVRDRITIEDKDGVLARLKRSTVYIRDHWIWTGTDVKHKQGYGRTQIQYKIYSVHRLSAYIFLGLDINDDSQQALHKDICHRRDCWNPEHLHIGTHWDNMHDKRGLGFKREIFRCGHPYTEENKRLNSQGYYICAICRLATIRKYNTKRKIA